MNNVEIRMTKENPINQILKKIYDLCARTEKFGEAIIDFAKKVPVNSITKPLIEQLVRAGTSVGANYCEADDSITKKDFLYRIGICRRESKESRFWLRMIFKAVPNMQEEGSYLLREATELNLIFSSIIRKSGAK